MRMTARIEPSTSPTPATGLDRLKLLRYCLARLRAWRSEYELYSHQPIAPEPWTPVARTPEKSPTPDLTADVLAPVVDESAQQKDSSRPSRKEPEMFARDNAPLAPAARPLRMAPDSASLYASTIDTESVQSHSALYQPTLPLADLPKPNLREPKLDAYSVEADTPSHPSEGTLDALPDTGRIARRAFDPLPGLGTSKLPVMPPAATKLKTPRVVSQILADAPTHWKSLAEAIAARVQEAGLKSLMVASALRGEGVTTVATALAIAVAQHGPMKVCLVDGNFSHPALANTLRLTARVGMEHHLRDNVALADTIVSFEKISLAVLPTLEAIDLPNVVLGMEKLKEVIGRLTQTYDLVIVDQGSLFSERKPTHLPEGIDATLLVRDPSKCSPELLDQLDGYVARHQISSLGVIENGVDDE